MRRREFIALLGSGVAGWPLALRAQQAAKLPTIGFLGANNASFERGSTDAFVQRLRELGWIDNRTVAIEYRWAEGREARFAEIATEFVRLKVDVIFTYATPSSIAAKRATAVIPIVFAAAGDPVGSGLVASLARPGGNITGLSIQQTDLASKRLEILRELLPGLRTLAILVDTGASNSDLERGEAQTAANALGLATLISEVRRVDDIAPAFDALKGRAEALYVCGSPLLTTNRIRVNNLALGVPEEFGGIELDPKSEVQTFALIAEEIARGDSGLADKLVQNWKVSVLLRNLAPRHLQEKWFARLIGASQFLLAHCLTEPRGASCRWLPYNVPEVARQTRAVQ